MKKFIVCGTLLLLPLYFFAQPVRPDSVAPATDYMKKSKRQRTTANILLYGGIATVITSIAIASKETDDAFIDLFGGDETSDFGAANVLLITGLTSIAGSIPLFIAAGKNRRKAAATVSLDMKKIYWPGPLAQSAAGSSFQRFSYPALTLKIPL